MYLKDDSKDEYQYKWLFLTQMLNIYSLLFAVPDKAFYRGRRCHYYNIDTSPKFINYYIIEGNCY